MMNRNMCALAVCLAVAFFSIAATSDHSHADDSKTPYPNMACLDHYLMDRDAEIALARTAAPASISGDATILVLGEHGYQTAVNGTNGFVCAVEHGWTGPIDHPEV
ncbi:MAG TPA: hypothetical protein VIW67_24190, partial [Terriglobales bacterium]